jgi:predicted ATP-grasp superfamily ATP-dependent carboligase
VRILVHEFFSGGGLAGQDVPASLAREGAAMLTALVTDLAAIDGHRIVTTVDSRFRLATPPGVDVVTLSAATKGRGAVLDGLISSVDAVWFIAPETDRCLERLTARAERRGVALFGSGSAAIRRASDKAALPRLLSKHRVSHPKTRVIDPARSDWKAHVKIAAGELGYPLVVKPARGAGCEGISLVRNDLDLHQAIDMARRTNRDGRFLLQRHVRGLAASVSLLGDGRRAMALTTNAQYVRGASPFAYRGGVTPLDHPLARRAEEDAVRACAAIPGLRGYIGVDVILARSDVLVIEVNPRLTTAYLGVRWAIDQNVAGMVLAACAGTLPDPSPARGTVRFTAGGRITSCTV